MKLFYLFLVISISFLLPSCEFNCSIGKKDEVKGTAVVKDGARIYNDIQLAQHNVQVSKAYLVFKDGTAMPEGNLVDFTQPVKLQLLIDKGWNEEGNKVMLGASEKITAEDGTVILDEKDLFSGKPEESLSVTDAKAITLTATIILKKEIPPTSFTVSFKIWDKRGDGFVEGNYKLYSK